MKNFNKIFLKLKKRNKSLQEPWVWERNPTFPGETLLPKVKVLNRAFYN